MMQSIQSRLKSRKVLGVGEGANGRQHRSKITQILGCDSRMASQLSPYEYPVLLQLLQYASCLWFSAIGLVAFFMPDSEVLGDVFGTGIPTDDDTQQSPRELMITRRYGVSMIALATLCVVVTFFNWQSRRAVRITLLIVSLYITYDFFGLWMDSDALNWTHKFRLSMLMRAVMLSLSFYFFKCT